MASSQLSDRVDGPPRVRVYGGDHSPWVQSILLGLHEKQVSHVTVPPLRVFLRSGILMPAARFGDGPWTLDAGRILAELGFSGVADADRQALQAVFADALERADDAWQFWYRWSWLRDGHPSLPRRLWNHFWRSFATFYFFVLITIARRRLARPMPERMRQAFGYWEARLESGNDFLGGDAPKLVRLRERVSRMQARFADYPYLYTGPWFEPRQRGPERAPVHERLFYWLGCAAMWLAFPLSLATVLVLVRRIRSKGLVPS